MPHSLPSTDSPLSEFTAFFKSAHFTRTGECNVAFTLPVESAAAVLDLNGNDGMALNITVWGTELPEADAELARMLGMNEGLGLGDLDDSS